MGTYLTDLGSDIWRSVIIGYQVLVTLTTDIFENKLYENNTRYMKGILCGLPNSELEKIMHCELEKDI